ncbi:hypothetical protein [uncultured Acinetobacter sp.]|uniref:hypothetical protein n=1 Tax=uncultured Acinetobacter sp. TaxID=165433 RepID=UPI0025832857|nr:hypothetical protein [uncultured Acinetobacter sp.]
MEHSFVLDIKNKIQTNRHIKEDMANVCYAIIDYVSIKPSQKNHLSFLDLYRVSPKVDEDIFYDAVFYLTRKHINVLVQEFEALDLYGSFTQVPDREQILEDMRNEEFFNPFSGKPLTEEEFGQEILTYFTPSPCFMEMFND